MKDFLGYPTPTNCDVQVFNASSANATTQIQTWNKPTGVSFVWFTLIGPGGQGSGGSTSAGGGGGSGAVTNFLCPAFLIPDTLYVRVPSVTSSRSTAIVYKDSSTDLLTAGPGQPGGTATGGAGASAMTANFFTCMGLFQSVAGQNGAVGTWPGASTTTFLCGGLGTNAPTITIDGNYGYSTNTGGIFQFQPIVMGLGSSNATNGPTGCGGGGNAQSTAPFGYGGPGMAVIISW